MNEAPVHPLKRLWRRAPRYRPKVVRGAIWAVLNQILDILPELLIGVAIDVVVREQGSFVGQWTGIEDREGQLFALAGVTAVVWILESITEYLAQRAWRTLSQDLQHDLRMDAYGHVQELELAWFEDREAGRLLKILQTITSVIGVGAVFFVISPLLAVLAFLPIPVIVGGSLIFQRRLEPRYAAVRDRAGRLGGLIGGNLGGIATIKAFGAERRESARVADASISYAAANREAINLSAAFVPVIRIAILIGFMVTLVVGGHLTLNGTLEIGMYSVLVFMTQRLLWPLTELGETLDLYQRGTASLRRILDLIDAPVAVRPGTRELPLLTAPTRGRAVAFDDVAFVYRDGDGAIRTRVLDGLSLDIAAGETHAIVGPTGAGKSTVVKLLLRLYDADGGSVEIDGVPVQTLTFDALRGTIGYVGQDTFLFDGSVADNLRYGSPDATDEQLRVAAEQAEAHDFVAALPQGYDTPVGERGVRLSGGQRQRLTIARALVRDPSILVLDEATSAVDNETEAAIQRSLLRVSRERTTIVIAHRLSTIRHADRIHVLDGGRVAEAGTHDELVARRGRYAALWAVQTGEITPPSSNPAARPSGPSPSPTAG